MKTSTRVLVVLVSLLINLNAYGQTTATGTAIVTNGFVVGVIVTDGGAGYTRPPSVTFSGGGGSFAGAYGVVSNGMVTQVVVTNAGYGYVSAPEVIIAPPNANYSFRSGSAYVVVPDSPSLESTTNQMTVECWFDRVTNPYDWNALISKDPTGFNTYDYELRFSGNEPVGTMHLSGAAGSDYMTQLQPPYPSWHHYAMEFDGTNFSIWLDGQLVFVTNAPGQIELSGYPLTIGCQSSGMRAFDGFIDEVRISDIARYNEEFNPQARFSPDVNTIALYHFDEDGGSIAYDSSGNGNNGTIYSVSSGTWSTNVPPLIPQAVLDIHKLVYVSFSNLALGTNYQLQVSGTPYGQWTNFGVPFTAISHSMTYSNYWDVSSWDSLFFRLIQ